MPRGVRKTTKERLKANLVTYKQVAARLEKELAETKSKIEETISAIQLEELKEVSVIMNEAGVDFEQLKMIIKKSQKRKDE